MMRPVALVLALLSLALPIGSQQPDDESDEHRAQDERYYRRYTERPADEVASDDDAQTVLARAEELVRDRNHRAERTDRWWIQTDDPRLDLRAVVRLLQELESYFERFWDTRAPLLADAQPARIYLFYSFHDYNQLAGGVWARRTLRPSGHYGSLFDLIVVHSDSEGAGGLSNTLVHEATHRLVDRRLYGPRGTPPPWVAEGLASYFGETWFDGTAFQPGIIGGQKLELVRDGESGRSDARGKLRALENALRAGEPGQGSLVGRLIDADAAAFYGTSTLEHYAASWMLVHYLFHGPDPARGAGFVRYLQGEERDGRALLAAVGATPEALDAALLEHVRRVKVR